MNLELQRILLGDMLRNRKLDQALKKLVKKGDVVLDLGAGTGLLGFLALRHGAAQVVFVEERPTLEFAVAMADQLGVSKQCEFFQMHSSEVELNTKADVLICETLGNFAFEEDILDTVEDGKKWLKPQARILPSEIGVWAVPVTASTVQKKIDVCSPRPFDLPTDELRKTFLCRLYSEEVRGADCLKDSRRVIDVQLKKKCNSQWRSSVTWLVSKQTKVHGFCLYWEATLVPGIVLSTSPWQSPLGGKTHLKQIYLPLLSSLPLAKGSQLKLDLYSDTRRSTGVHVQWSGGVGDRRGNTSQHFSMDTDIGRVGEF